MSTAAKAPINLSRPAGPKESRRELWLRGAAAAVFVVAAAITWNGARSMSGGMPMPGGWVMPMMWMHMPGQTVWSAAVMFLLMWQAMMIAMMLPSSWPMLELYQRVAVSSGERWPGLSVAFAGAGYFAVWLGFGAVALWMGSVASDAAMKSAALSRMMPAAAGVALIVAGLYQWSPWKQACLAHCRSPLLFLAHVFQPGLRGALRVGMAHGIFCTGCCWALMVIQMILGVMNLSVMLLVAAVIAVEKLWKRGPLFARLVGGAAIGIGAFYLVNALV
jgi:predicted metal-binding membrane protein